jgi:hypothetical protein
VPLTSSGGDGAVAAPLPNPPPPPALLPALPAAHRCNDLLFTSCTYKTCYTTHNNAYNSTSSEWLD